MQAVIRIDQQDVVVITADAKHLPHRLQFEPVATARLGLRHEDIKTRTAQLLLAKSRVVDTSEWLG
eukprot:409516-Karenia_brevis.AAC.1